MGVQADAKGRRIHGKKEADHLGLPVHAVAVGSQDDAVSGVGGEAACLLGRSGGGARPLQESGGEAGGSLVLPRGDPRGRRQMGVLRCALLRRSRG